MAWVSPKVYAILKNSEEGKDILEGIADKDQAEVDKEVDAFFGKGGKGYKSNAEYSQAKFDDEAEEERYKSMSGEDYEHPSGPRDVEEPHKEDSRGKEEENVKKKDLDSILKERSTFMRDKDYDASSFRRELEENGYEVDYVDNRSGTWKDHNGEKFKEYDIKLKNGQHIYFRLIADENYDTKEIITYKNGKDW